MVSIIYKELFEIEFLHNFYKDGRCVDLQLQPSQQCAQVLRQLGLYFLPTPTGAKVLARANKEGLASAPVYKIKSMVPDDTKLTFFISIKLPTFETFTETKLDRRADQYYYFNNLLNNTTTDNTPLLVLNTVTKQVTDTDIIKIKQRYFAYTHTSTATEQTAKLNALDDEESIEKKLQNDSGKFEFTFDLQTLAAGRTELVVEDVRKEFFYNLPATEHTRFFGIVEIFYNQALATHYQFIQPDGTINTRHYKIVFGNRATRWRYFITQRFNQSITQVTVQRTNGVTIDFLAQPGTVDGQFVVASTGVVPLKEQPVAGIQLKDQANKIIIAHLPNPALTHLKKEGADLFSDIYVTI